MKRFFHAILVASFLTACSSHNSGISKTTVPSSSSTSSAEIAEEASPTSTSQDPSAEKVALNADILKDHPFSLSMVASFEQPIELIAVPETEVLLLSLIHI